MSVRITRRTVLTGIGGVALAGLGTGAYGVGIEPMRLVVTRYALHPLGPWPAGFRLRIVALADLHACEPWMPLSRIEGIVATANTLGGDVTVLLGDYVSGLNAVTRYVDAAEWAPVLGRLKAPLGTYAILGNHDWWEDRTAQRRGAGPTIAGAALARNGIRVLENAALPLTVRGRTFWVAGLGDQLAFQPSRRRRGAAGIGQDDLPGTLAQIPMAPPRSCWRTSPTSFPKSRRGSR